MSNTAGPRQQTLRACQLVLFEIVVAQLTFDPALGIRREIRYEWVDIASRWTENQSNGK